MTAQNQTAPESTQAAQTVTLELSPEAKAQMDALQAELATERAERERAEAAAVELRQKVTANDERLAAMEVSARTKRLTDLVLGRGEGVTAGAAGRRWFGSVDDHVSIMETLGEGTPAFDKYVAQQQAHAEQLHTSGLFKEVGRDASGASQTADGQLQALAKTIREGNPTLTDAQAYDEASKQRPDLLGRAVRGE